jgi:hypothetical protein
MRIRLLEIAQIELEQAIEYYNYEFPGLGNAFLTEVLKVFDRIGEFPKHGIPCQPELGDVKRGGFPMESFTRFGKTRF